MPFEVWHSHASEYSSVIDSIYFSSCGGSGGGGGTENWFSDDINGYDFGLLAIILVISFFSCLSLSWSSSWLDEWHWTMNERTLTTHQWSLWLLHSSHVIIIIHNAYMVLRSLVRKYISFCTHARTHRLRPLRLHVAVRHCSVFNNERRRACSVCWFNIDRLRRVHKSFEYNNYRNPSSHSPLTEATPFPCFDSHQSTSSNSEQKIWNPIVLDLWRDKKMAWICIAWRVISVSWKLGCIQIPIKHQKSWKNNKTRRHGETEGEREGYRDKTSQTVQRLGVPSTTTTTIPVPLHATTTWQQINIFCSLSSAICARTCSSLNEL